LPIMRQPCLPSATWRYSAIISSMTRMGEALKESGCTLHAWVLMSNPVHWLLTPPQPQDVRRLIISLGRRSVRYINKTYHRTGTLWDSRYTSSLVQEDTY
jgi:REP-associated tyrosine transposase